MTRLQRFASEDPATAFWISPGWATARVSLALAGWLRFFGVRKVKPVYDPDLRTPLHEHMINVMQQEGLATPADGD